MALICFRKNLFFLGVKSLYISPSPRGVALVYQTHVAMKQSCSDPQRQR